MKIVDIIVDKIPPGCSSCQLMIYDGAANFYCAALSSSQDKADVFFGMDNFRRSDCPLVEKELESEEYSIFKLDSSGQSFKVKYPQDM